MTLGMRLRGTSLSSFIQQSAFNTYIARNSKILDSYELSQDSRFIWTVYWVRRKHDQFPWRSMLYLTTYSRFCGVPFFFLIHDSFLFCFLNFPVEGTRTRAHGGGKPPHPQVCTGPKRPRRGAAAQAPRTGGGNGFGTTTGESLIWSAEQHMYSYCANTKLKRAASCKNQAFDTSFKTRNLASMFCDVHAFFWVRAT